MIHNSRGGFFISSEEAEILNDILMDDIARNIITNPYNSLGFRPATAENIIIPKAEKVIVNYPATIVFWSDGTKTIVKCDPADSRNFSVETGVMLCLVKKMLGNTSGALNNTMREMTEMAELVNVPRHEKKAQAPKPKEQTPKPKKKTVYISPDELF